MMVNTWWSFRFKSLGRSLLAKWCCPTWNITTSQGATSSSNSVKFKWQSNWAFQRWYFKLLKFKMVFQKLPHAFTHIGQIRLEDYWGENGKLSEENCMVPLTCQAFPVAVQEVHQDRDPMGADPILSYDMITSFCQHSFSETIRVMLKTTSWFETTFICHPIALLVGGPRNNTNLRYFEGFPL